MDATYIRDSLIDTYKQVMVCGLNEDNVTEITSFLNFYLENFDECTQLNLYNNFLILNICNGIEDGTSTTPLLNLLIKELKTKIQKHLLLNFETIEDVPYDEYQLQAEALTREVLTTVEGMVIYKAYIPKPDDEFELPPKGHTKILRVASGDMDSEIAQSVIIDHYGIVKELVGEPQKSSRNETIDGNLDDIYNGFLSKILDYNKESTGENE